MQFFHLYKTIFLIIFCFRNIMIYKLSIVNAIEMMKIKDLRDLICENCYCHIGFTNYSIYSIAQFTVIIQ